MNAPMLDTTRAQIGRTPHSDAVTIDDPASPWIVHAHVTQNGGRPCLTSLHIEARSEGACITNARLTRLPVAQILHIAAAELLGSLHEDEMYYRLLAQPRQPGSRGWDDDHYLRVLAVHEWAQLSGRPGGGAQAVADLWGVAKNPTVWRWLAKARRVAEASSAEPIQK